MTKDLLHQSEVRELVSTAYRSIESPRAAGACLYDPAQLGHVPGGAEEWSLGVGNPVRWAQLCEGEEVLDVGCGAGIDTLLAARAVAPLGTATGLDLLPEMLERAASHAADAEIDNVAFVRGEMEDMPFEDSSFDVIVSNGTLNLSPRKARVCLELARVLRAGGRISLTDITLEEDLPPQVMTHPKVWAG